MRHVTAQHSTGPPQNPAGQAASTCVSAAPCMGCQREDMSGLGSCLTIQMKTHDSRALGFTVLLINITVY